MPKLPENKSLILLEREGWTADKVEVKVTRTITRDWCGFADIIAFHPDGRVLCVQSTDDTHVAARRNKIMASDHARAWLDAGHGIEIHGFRQGDDPLKGLVWRRLLFKIVDGQIMFDNHHCRTPEQLV